MSLKIVYVCMHICTKRFLDMKMCTLILISHISQKFGVYNVNFSYSLLIYMVVHTQHIHNKESVCIYIYATTGKVLL